VPAGRGWWRGAPGGAVALNAGGAMGTRSFNARAGDFDWRDVYAIELILLG